MPGNFKHFVKCLSESGISINAQRLKAFSEMPDVFKIGLVNVFQLKSHNTILAFLI